MKATSSVAVVLAAGRGSRIGGPTPKQLLDLCGRPVFVHVVALHLAAGRGVVLVASDEVRTAAVAMLEEHVRSDVVRLVSGGSTRRASVLAGVAALPVDMAPEAGVILHNAASPNTPEELIGRCLIGLAAHDGTQAYVRSGDTTIIHRDGSIREVLPRAETGTAVDPTVYRRELLDAIADELRRGETGETTLDIALRLGADIGLVESDRANLKITVPGDLERVAAAMSHRTRADGVRRVC